MDRFKTRFLMNLHNGSLQRPTLPLAPVEDKNFSCAQDGGTTLISFPKMPQHHRANLGNMQS